jgi:hypothetical protein
VPKAPAEPTNLVLEQLRAMRAEARAHFDAIEARLDRTDARFDRIEADISDIKKDMRGFKLNTIAEVYKANLTVASFVDHEQRIQTLERKSP